PAAAPASTGIVAEAGWPDTAVSGSLRPWPVIVHTTTAPAGTWPLARAWSSPATPAAEAGSPNTPSPLPTNGYGDRMWSAVPAAIRPRDSPRPASASRHEA